MMAGGGGTLPVYLSLQTIYPSFLRISQLRCHWKNTGRVTVNATGGEDIIKIIKIFPGLCRSHLVSKVLYL